MKTSSHTLQQLQTNFVRELVISAGNRPGYWRSGFGWVDGLEQASRFSEEEILEGQAAVVHWRMEGCADPKTGEYWWSSRKDQALLGYRGADFNGPFPSPIEAVLDAIDWLDIRPKMLDDESATFVVANEAVDQRPFQKPSPMEMAA